jgi:ABC-type multidrug transport system permease subunit
VAVIVMLLTMLGSGFVILRKQIPDWWSWMFWLSPLQHALTGLANNEFLGDSYAMQVLVAGETIQFGEQVLRTYEFNIGNKWR